MVAHQITLIPGDGIGPEVADSAARAVEATGVAVEWERVDAGERALLLHGSLIPDDVFASLEITRVGLKGPTATPIGGGHASINVALRKKLGLYVNFRPVRMLPGLKTSVLRQVFAVVIAVLAIEMILHGLKGTV